MKKRSTSLPAVESAPEEKKEFSLISNDMLWALYRNLLKCRLLEEQAGESGTPAVLSLRGWEAATVGVAMDLVTEDVVCQDGSDRLAPFLRGESPAQFLREAQQEAASQADLVRPLERALGAALRHKTAKTGKVSVAFWRNGAMNCWLDALEAARTHNLPIIFVCQTQLLDGRTRQEPRGPRSKVKAETPGLELPRIAVDGADVVAVYRVAHEAIDRARRDRGPTLIECSRFTVNGQRRRADSVANMEAYLRGKGLLARGAKQTIAEECARELNGSSLCIQPQRANS
jgi:pyruvate dehydrogenase E1 component alpha subunit